MIRDKLKHKYDEKNIDDNVNWFVLGEYDKMLLCLLIIGPAVSYDMGWQKRVTGRVYNSVSGHGFIIGCHTRCVIGMGVIKKKCSTCRSTNKFGNSTRAHKYNVNHKNSSGAMDSALALTLTISMFEKSKQKVCISQIATDNGSTMRAHIKNYATGASY